MGTGQLSGVEGGLAIVLFLLDFRFMLACVSIFVPFNICLFAEQGVVCQSRGGGGGE